MKRRFGMRKVAGILCMVVVGVFVFGSIVMLLWNFVFPSVLHAEKITYWQAVALLFLCRK